MDHQVQAVMENTNKLEKDKEDQAKVKLEKEKKEQEEKKKQEKLALNTTLRDATFDNPVLYFKDKIKPSEIGKFDRYSCSFGNHHDETVKGSELIDIGTKVIEQLNVHFTGLLIYELIGENSANLINEFGILTKKNAGMSLTKLGYVGSGTLANLEKLKDKYYHDETYDLDLYKWEDLNKSIYDYIGININMISVIISMLHKHITSNFSEREATILCQENITNKFSNFKSHFKILEQYKLAISLPDHMLYSKGRKSLNTEPKPKVKKTKATGGAVAKDEDKNKYNDINIDIIKLNMDKLNMPNGNELSKEVTALTDLNVDALTNNDINA